MLDFIQLGGMLTSYAILKAVDKKEIFISDFSPKWLNPNSYNIKTGRTVTVYDNINTIDLRNQDTYKDTETFELEESGFVLRPGILYLVPTYEEIGTNKYIPLITGRSSIGRLGVTIHQEAGFGDIGYRGVWTMQIRVTYPTIIYPEMPIAQVYFMTPCGDINTKYNGRYQGSGGAVPSRFGLSE